MKHQSLCFRCEHRARFLEGMGRPRHECGEIKSSKFGCYMYRPVVPVLVKPDDSDPRPQYGPAMISSRSYACGLPEVKTELHINKDKTSFIYYLPKEQDDTKEAENNE